MFALSENECTITDVNSRKELHGEDKVLAQDIHFTCDLANTILNVFDPELKPALYKADPTVDLDDPTHLPKLRFPFLGTLHWDLEITGCELTIHRGFSGDSDIVLPMVKVSKFRITCKEGGTVSVGFRAQFRVASPAQAGELDALIQETCPVTLVPKAFDEEVEKTEARTRAANPNQADLGLERADELDAARADCFKVLQEGGYYAITIDVIDGWSTQEIAQVRTFMLNQGLGGSFAQVALPPCLQAWLDETAVEAERGITVIE